MDLIQETKVTEKQTSSLSINLSIYTKFLRKGWLLAVIPGIIMAIFSLMMAGIWPEFKDQAALFNELLDNPIYAVFIGTDLNIGTFEGFFAIEIFTILEFIMVFLTIFIPVRIISTEVDKKTLDVILSYPIPRWKYLVQKFAVYNTQMLFIPIFIVLGTYIGATIVNEPFNFEGLILAVTAIYLLFFSLGAISLLATTLTLESGKALPLAGALILGMWVIERFGGLVESVSVLQNLSLFHYLIPRTILASSSLDIVNVVMIFLLAPPLVQQ